MGVVTALGTTPDEIFDAVLAGTTAGKPVERWADQGLRVSTAALVDRASVSVPVGPSVIGDVPVPWASAMAIPAARAALRDAGLREELGATPLVVSNTIGAPGSIEPVDKNWKVMDPTEPLGFVRYAQGALVAFVADALQARGPVRCLMSTCAAGNYVIGAALDIIRYGESELVLCGGLEEVSIMVYTAFHQLRAVSDRCRPFDKERNGLMFGEGAAFLVIESETHATARGARVYAHVAGVGYANDAHNMVQPDPKGAGAIAAIQNALADAALPAIAVDYVNAHGTGTEANDAAELLAVRTVFERPELEVSSTKGSTGHLMGAASTLEAVICVKAIERNIVPPTVRLSNPIDNAGLRLPVTPHARPVNVAVSSGFGFGGNDAVVVFARSSATADCEHRPVYVSQTFKLDKAGDLEATLGKKGLRHAERGAMLWAAMLERAPSFGTEGAVVGAAYPGYHQVVGIMRDYQTGGSKNVNPMRVPFATANCAASYWLIRRGVTGYSGACGSGECAGLDAMLSAAAH
ncbi:MAG: beta-ketoacyl-[acyl-carrier-protein] synthase family protein, partial [Clostridia bacterium]|nr:beta-ketoacyl-[acyl-carrier-protein] synthase family protein [Deltaproteobacteria bacterium]